MERKAAHESSQADVGHSQTDDGHASEERSTYSSRIPQMLGGTIVSGIIVKPLMAYGTLYLLLQEFKTEYMGGLFFIRNVLVIFLVINVIGLHIRTPRIYRSVTQTCVGAASSVLQAYAFLLAMDIRYTRIFIIPVIFFVFIVAIWSKFRTMEAYSLENDISEYKALRLDTMASLENIQWWLYIMQPPLLTMTKGLEDGSFVMAYFLVFFSAALLALADMIANLPVVASPSVAHVLPVMHKTCIAVVVITFHAAAAKWLGAHIVLVCLPEFVAVVVWFAAHYDHGGYTIRGLSNKSLSSVLVALPLLEVSINSNTTGKLASMIKVFYISGAQAAMSGFSAYMLQQWPGNSSNPMELLVEQLEYSANYHFATTLCFLLYVWYKP